MATVKLNADGEIILKQGNVSCVCCCPPITSDYSVISESMYNALRAGGTFNATGNASEPFTGCSFAGTSSGIIASENCGASVLIPGGVTCNDGSMDFNSFISVGWSIAKVGSEYRFTYSGRGSCFSDIFPGICYTVGFFIEWSWDNFGPPGSFTNVGTVTLTTSEGNMNFGIWNLDNTATASLDIAIS